MLHGQYFILGWALLLYINLVEFYSKILYCIKNVYSLLHWRFHCFPLKNEKIEYTFGETSTYNIYWLILKMQ